MVPASSRLREGPVTPTESAFVTERNNGSKMNKWWREWGNGTTEIPVTGCGCRVTMGTLICQISPGGRHMDRLIQKYVAGIGIYSQSKVRLAAPGRTCKNIKIY